MQQKILFSDESRQIMLQGMEVLFNAVRVTLGPSGRNVVFNHLYGGIRTTKDGVTVAREVSISDPLQNAGVKILRQASSRTAETAGDNTTTTCILAYHIIKEATQLIKEGANPVELRQGIGAAAAKCMAWMLKNSIKIDGKVERIRQVANISSNNDPEISDLIAKAFDQIGPDGVITLEDSPNEKTEIEILGGYSLNKGMIHPEFITNEAKRTCELSEPVILLYDKKISKFSDILMTVDYALNKVQRPLLIIAASAEGEALGTLIANKINNSMKICVVPCPEIGLKRNDIMNDIAIFTGGTVISEDKGMSIDKDNFKPSYLGQAQKVVVTKDSCIIVNGQGNPAEVEARQLSIKEMVKDASGDQEKEFLRRRAGSIGKGVAVLYVGAPTEIDRLDKKDLAEDAILATRSAIEYGFLPGGGSAMIRCAVDLGYVKNSQNKNWLSNFLFPKPKKQNLAGNILGEKIAIESLIEPLKQILVNCGLTKIDVIVNKVITGEKDHGYNARTNEFCNLLEEGVIDSAKAVMSAIENAFSVAQVFLSTEVLISEIPDPEN